MVSAKYFTGQNLGYVLELYDRYLESPDSVDAKTAEFFSTWSPDMLVDDAPTTNGALATPSLDMRKVVGAVALVQSIRQFGHLGAQLNPLGYAPPDDPSLHPETHGISEDDLKAIPASLVTDGTLAQQANNAYQVVQELRDIYSRSIGWDNEHLHIPEERTWLREAIESRRFRYEGTPEESKTLLQRLTQVEVMEHFLQRAFPTKYRFSVEGLDMMVPMLDEVVNYAKSTQSKLVAIGMAHRGRLNVLAHVMHRDYEKILAEFTDKRVLVGDNEAIGWTVDDVKYHKGAEYEVPESDLLLKMSPNPSHLEAVNPVVVGMARAAATKRHVAGSPEFDPFATAQVLVHGDAAFPGQGIVAETFNMSKLPGFAVGGTLHIIANNQLGFTTLPEDGRSTLYASDLAKGFSVPIVHVNADDPAACLEVARLAAAYTAEFEKDFLVDLVGYRRYGHNELDEPGFTQPKMYADVRAHDTVRKLWADTLVARGEISEDDAQALVDEATQNLQSIYDAMAESQEGIADLDVPEPAKGLAKKVTTQVDADTLIAINDGLRGVLEGFNFYSTRFKKTILNRRTTLNDPEERGIDWAGAEEFAFATILADGIPIRFTGQEAQRGTFSHRHAVLHDSDNGNELTPLQIFPQATASFEIHNSPLSEEAILGFEYGYNIEAADTLVIWEAQYGDFVNGAQNIIDEFISSAREKWGDRPSLVMLLPHGHEGAGPDHSSARPERFLTIAANTNMRIVNPTTAGQYFHLLRRQALLLESDPLPLIVMAPKSLLRSPNVMANMNDLTTGKWHPVIDDTSVKAKDVKRLVFCTGKFYYDLANADFREQYSDVALVRVEQLYPFPVAEMREIVDGYPNVEQIVWAQEEPKNMGAWEYMGYRLKKLVGMGTPVNYVGRRRSSSPAEGSKTAWAINQSMITEYAFDWDFETDSKQPRHK
ncbi:MAG: 2-oxoglutarate dehydrogenase E1 component [Phototrophicaceae bacterium]